MTKTNNAKVSWNISFVTPVVGLLNRSVLRFPVLGKNFLALSNKMIGKLLPNLAFLGFRKEANYENAIWNWEIFLNLIGAEYKVEEISEDSKIYTFKKCPAGYCRSEHLNVCKATMELDHSLVESSGAKLIVEKRFPIDGICVEKIIRS
ncbi:hypothetical protein QUF76_11485 [Desulfobacterales bacterium HSG16]|nr:hypothetical protein [Desulfobacterales bacterium HSG16]